MEPDIQSWLQNAGDQVHLNRERAITALEDAIDTQKLAQGSSMIATLQLGAIDMTKSSEWERRLGGLRITTVVVAKGLSDDQLQDAATQACLELLEDSEVRVRLAVGGLLKALAADAGTVVWQHTQDRILTSIQVNFVRCVFVFIQSFTRSLIIIIIPQTGSRQC